MQKVVFADTNQVQYTQSLTVEQVLDEALENSPAVVKARAAYDEQGWKKVEAVSAFLPTVTGSLNYITNKKYTYVDMNMGGNPTSVAQIVPTTQYTASARWNVFDGFASTYRFKAAQQLQESSRLDYEWVKFQTERQALLAYYKVLAAEQIKQAAEQNLKALKDHTKDVQALKKAGISTQYDVLRTEVQQSESESDLISAEDQLIEARNRLAEILGKSSEDRMPNGQLPVLGCVRECG
ncbi:MAG: TolC family protein [Pseudobdellovibrio sp.]